MAFGVYVGTGEPVRVVRHLVADSSAQHCSFGSISFDFEWGSSGEHNMWPMRGFQSYDQLRRWQSAADRLLDFILA
jgi:hypothetical protein